MGVKRGGRGGKGGKGAGRVKKNITDSHCLAVFVEILTSPTALREAPGIRQRPVSVV